MLESQWRWSTAAIVLYGIAILICWQPDSRIRGAVVQAPAAAASQKQRYFASAQSCGQASCHISPPNIKKPLLCACTEYPIWANKDRHSKAFVYLSSPLGKAMQQLLGSKHVTKADACLACHGAVMTASDEKDDEFQLSEGVTCCICHGPYQDWVTKHQPLGTNIKQWRAVLHADKEQRYGMTDLWNPAERAALCVSCHLGAPRHTEGPFQAPQKFITHEMYAAGHPPLPALEVATYSDQMRHWQYLREKPPAIQKILLYDGRDLERAHLVLVSAAVALRDAMRLLADQAKACVSARNPDERALDFANFDCYACHHDLQSSGSWRQQRGAAGKPGRVPMRPIATVLVKLGLRQAYPGPEVAQKEAELGELVRKVADGFTRQPFGDATTIAPAAQELAQWADRLASELKSKDCDEAVVRRLLTALPALATAQIQDYDSARQIAWAYRTIYYEYCAATKSRESENIQKILKDLDKQLQLSGGPTNQLAVLNKYDPREFKKCMEALSAAMHGGAE